MNLHQRQVIDEAQCEACSLGKESSGHAFWECGKAQEVWSLSSIVFETQGIHYQEFVDMVWYLIFIQHAKDDTSEMIFMVAWCMWFNRNAAQHGSVRQLATMVVQKLRLCLLNFREQTMLLLRRGWR